MLDHFFPACREQQLRGIASRAWEAVARSAFTRAVKLWSRTVRDVSDPSTPVTCANLSEPALFPSNAPILLIRFPEWTFYFVFLPRSNAARPKSHDG